MTKTQRLIFLYVILLLCVINVGVALVTGDPVPEPLYGVLGTIVTYVILKGNKTSEDDEESKGDDKQ